MDQCLTFRRATASDAAAVRALTRAAYAKWVPVIGREPLPMAADYDRAVREHVVELLEDRGDLVGLIGLITRPDHMLIENLAVRIDLQGKGHGDRLLRHAEDITRHAGLSEMCLYTNAAFASNIAFYTKRSYTEFKRDVMVPGSVTVHMRKRLTK